MAKYYLFITSHIGSKSIPTEFCEIFTDYEEAKNRLLRVVEAQKNIEGEAEVKETYRYEYDPSNAEVAYLTSMQWRFYKPLLIVTVENEVSGIKSERFIIPVTADEVSKVATSPCADTLSMIWAAVQDKNMSRDEFYEHVRTLLLENFG